MTVTVSGCANAHGGNLRGDGEGQSVLWACTVAFAIAALLFTDQEEGGLFSTDATLAVCQCSEQRCPLTKAKSDAAGSQQA